MEGKGLVLAFFHYHCKDCDYWEHRPAGRGDKPEDFYLICPDCGKGLPAAECDCAEHFAPLFERVFGEVEQDG